MLAVAPALCGAQVLTFGGSSAGIGTLRVLLEQFSRSHPLVTGRAVQDLSSTGGIKAVIAGKLDLAVSTRALKPSEQDDAVQVELGRTPFVVAVAATNPTNALTSAELEAFYAGTRTRWPDGRPLRLILAPAGDRDNELLAALSAGMHRAVTAAHARPGMLVEPTDRTQADAIVRVPDAPGTSTLALIRTEGPQLKPVALDGVMPSPEAVASGAYPVVKTIRLMISRRAPAVVQEFVDFVRSPKGRAVLHAAGYVPH